MGASVQPDPAAVVDPTKPRLSLAAPQQPGMAGGTAPSAQAPLSPSTLVPTPTVAAPAAPVDRLALATSNFDTFAKSTDPAYQKTLRDATQQAAGTGGLGSGMLKTSLGDLASNRQLQLDTLRSDLLNKATEGSIADAQTAYGQALSGAQQGLATKIGEGQLALGTRAADTADKSVGGNLDVAKGQLDLAKTGQEASIGQSQQQLDLAKKTADINAQFQAGTLTLAQKDQALKELQNTQQFGLAGQQLDLAKKTADINAQFQAGTLTLAQKDQALKELQNTQQFGLAGQQLDLAKTGQAADIASKQAQLDLATKSLAQSGIQFNAQLAEQEAARAQQGSQFDKSLAQSGDQFKASLAQNAEQFGLGQAQQMALAKLQDATANRSIDVSSEQGKNQLLIQLAGIIGGPTGASNPAALAAIAKQFGIVIPATTSTTGQTTGTVGDVPSELNTGGTANGNGGTGRSGAGQLSLGGS